MKMVLVYADNGGIAAGTVVIIVVPIIIFTSLVSLACFFIGMLKQKQIRNNQGRKYGKFIVSSSSGSVKHYYLSNYKNIEDK